MALSEDQLVTRVSTMPERYADRIPEALERSVTVYRNAGEWRLAVEGLEYLLVKKQVTLSTREQQELQEVMTAMQLSPEHISKLPTRPSLSPSELSTQLSSLPEQFSNRLPEPDLTEIRECLDSQEYRDLAETLMDSLRENKVSITKQEQDQLWLILDALDLPRLELAHLTVT